MALWDHKLPSSSSSDKFDLFSTASTSASSSSDAGLFGDQSKPKSNTFSSTLGGDDALYGTSTTRPTPSSKLPVGSSGGGGRVVRVGGNEDETKLDDLQRVGALLERENESDMDFGLFGRSQVQQGGGGGKPATGFVKNGKNSVGLVVLSSEYRLYFK